MQTKLLVLIGIFCFVIAYLVKNTVFSNQFIPTEAIQAFSKKDELYNKAINGDLNAGLKLLDAYLYYEKYEDGELLSKQLIELSKNNKNSKLFYYAYSFIELDCIKKHSSLFSKECDSSRVNEYKNFYKNYIKFADKN